MKKPMLAICMVGVLALAVGCDDDNSDVFSPITREPMVDQMISTVDDTEALLHDMVQDKVDEVRTAAKARMASQAREKNDNEPRTTEVTFNVERPCPKGGTASVEAFMRYTIWPENNTFESEMTGSHALNDCAYKLPLGSRLTFNGEGSFEAFIREIDEEPDGLQTSSYDAWFSAQRNDGEERSCQFGFESVRDPDAQTASVSGSVCGTTFETNVRWYAAE